MKITVIGAGNMGAAFVKQLTRAGHQVSVTARDSARQRTSPPQTLAPWLWLRPAPRGPLTPSCWPRVTPMQWARSSRSATSKARW
jgi:predicted dinucleotide-binding enzyme